MTTGNNIKKAKIEVAKVRITTSEEIYYLASEDDDGNTFDDGMYELKDTQGNEIMINLELAEVIKRIVEAFRSGVIIE